MRNIHECLPSGEYREEISLPNYYDITYRVYAHQYYNRLLVTEIRIQRTGNDQQIITIDRNSLTGNMSSIDIGFAATTQYTQHVACTTTAFDC